MKIKSLKHLTFQRNGVAGECFYHAIITNNLDKGLHFVVTFQQKVNTEFIEVSTCRVFCIEQPLESWRGDNFGYALNDWLENEGQPIYNLTTNYARSQEYERTHPKETV